MGYKSTEEMLEAYRTFITWFSEVPDQFIVHNDYLIDGMSEVEFVKGYREYRELLIRIQLAMCDKPDEYGLYKYDSKGVAKPANIMNHPALWLFVALSQAGKVKNDALHVNGKEFNSFLGGKAIASHNAIPKNVDNMLSKLPCFGFTVSGYASGEETDFTVSSDIPRLITAIKASTLSQYCKKSLLSEYVSFNYRIYEIGSNERLPMDQSYIFRNMPADKQKAMQTLMDALAEHGWKSYSFRHHAINRGWISYPVLELYYNTNGVFWLMMGTPKVENRLDYVHSLPDKFKHIWAERVNKCRGCRKGDCQYRFIGELLDKKGVLCIGCKIPYPLEVETVPTIIEMCLLFSGKQKNKTTSKKN